MAFINTQFPVTISRGSSGGPAYQTTITLCASGIERANSDWSTPRHEFDAATGVKSAADLHSVLAFFHVMKGRFNSFRWKDWADYKSCAPTGTVSVTDQVIGTGTGAQTAFQLIKTYSAGGSTQVRTITLPVSGTVAAALNSTPTTAFTVNTQTGVITFSSPPGAGVVVTAGYEFDVPCRFDSDSISVSMDSYKLGSATIPVIEVKSEE